MHIRVRAPELSAAFSMVRNWIMIQRSAAFSTTSSSRQDLCRDTGRQGVMVTRSPSRQAPRSEEHTSELQSRGHLVCRLLLEKKKKKKTKTNTKSQKNRTTSNKMRSRPQ